MNNAVKVLVRDLRRFARVPQAVVIMIGIIIIPSLYAWLNIIAFWNPYGNTEDISVAVVNLDKGAESELTGELNIGAQVIEQLKDNHEIGWQFMDEDEGMTAVKSGDVYATIVIDRDFSADLLTITSGNFVQPELQYYVNEKVNAIAPKITGVAASTLETQINSTFVSTVAETVAAELEKTGGDLGAQMIVSRDNTRSVLFTSLDQIADAREGLAELQTSLSSGETALGDARAALQDADAAMGDVQTAVGEAEAVVAEVQTGLIGFTDALTQSFVTGSAQLTGISATLNDKLATLTAATSKANAAIATAIQDAEAVNATNGQAIADLQAVSDGLPEGPEKVALTELIEKLSDRQVADAELLQSLEKVKTQVTSVTNDLGALASTINDAVSRAANSAGSIRDVMTNTVPDINRAMNAVSASAGGLSSALDAQKVLLAEAISLIDNIGGQLELVSESVGSLDTTLLGVQTSLTNLAADLNALSAADIWKKVGALTELNPDTIGKFMASPVTVQTHTVFPVATYGSSMAPLFTNLSLWIAAFVLVVLLKQEVDTEEVEGLTVRQAYMGRWMLLMVVNLFQALLVSIGNVIIGVQMASAIAFVLTSVFVGFVYTALIYAIAVSFGYVGKGFIILLVIMQIPGASGIYPIQMMPEFFQALFPFFPFTYGIDAMRETIGGFYHADYWRSIAVLALYAVLSVALGMFFRQRLGNFARLFNRRLSDTGLFVSENVQILGSRRRVTQIVQALTNRENFVKKTKQQARWFQAHHLTLLKLALLVGVVVTAVLYAISWILPDAKTTILALWGVLCFALIGFVVVLEYLKQNVNYARQVESLGSAELQERLAAEERATHSNAKLSALAGER